MSNNSILANSVDSAWIGREDPKLHWLAMERLEKFRDKTNWNDRNLSRTASKLYSNNVQFSISAYSAPNQTKPLFNEILAKHKAGEFHPITLGHKFGPSWSSHWLFLQCSIDNSLLHSHAELHVRLDCSAEACLFDKNGVALQGFAGTSGEDRREEYKIDLMNDSNIRAHMDNQSSVLFEYYAEISCNGLFGNCTTSLIGPPDENRFFELSLAELSVLNREFYELSIDYDIVVDMAKYLPINHPTALKAIRVANQFVNNLIISDSSTYARAREILQQFLYRERNCSETAESAGVIYAVGHCHIDTCWLWDYSATIRKCCRSFGTQLTLLREFPQYHFNCSQAQQLAWVQEYYPELFNRIKEEKRFSTIGGGSWVEFDCNLPTGESMARQLLYGQRFFEATFGSKSKVFWLPDTFGYSAALPQLLNQAGMKYFLTQKLSWNLINQFPYHNFVWEGIDGASSVLTMFPSADTYNAKADVKSVLHTVNNNKDKAINNEHLIMLFGYGDGEKKQPVAAAFTCQHFLLTPIILRYLY
jgi:alpha-mannosidase